VQFVPICSRPENYGALPSRGNWTPGDEKNPALAGWLGRGLVYCTYRCAQSKQAQSGQ